MNPSSPAVVEASCPPRAELLAFVNGETPAECFEGLARHVESCSVCLAVLENGDPCAECGADQAATPITTALFCRPLACQSDWERAQLPCRFGEYELLEEVGRGGMGIVYKAHQQRAERIVALKQMRAEYLDALSSPERTEAVARFRREAQSAAQLRHDNLVPVYDVGEVEGCPFYTMPYVEGHSLADELQESPLPPQRAAFCVEAVSRAVQHVHDHGLLHRDIKPRNILIDRTGRPYLTDFGLVKNLKGDHQLTGTGRALGTLPYASPEQVQDGARVEPSGDVYSLGATLYALVTGRPPFQAAGMAELLDQVRTCEPVPPRRLNPAIPRDLETIALKCLEKEPRRRYSSAAALADDLGRFRAGLPIRTRPVSPPERLYRWARRNWLVAGLVAALLLVLVSYLASVTYLWRLAESRREAASQQKEEADLQRKRAEQGFGLAHQAVHDHIMNVQGSKELKKPGLEPLRKTLLKTALLYYQEFARQRAHDSGAQEEVAWAYVRVAQICRLTGDNAEAVPAAEQAAALFELFVRDNPDSLDYQHRLAWIYSELGMAQRALGREDEALQSYKKALALRERMVESNPVYPGAQANLAWSYANLGEWFAGKKQLAEAHEYFQKSYAKWQEVCQGDPANRWQRSMWAHVCGYLGHVKGMTDHPTDALRFYKQSRDLYAQLAKEAPDDYEAEENLALACIYLGRGYLGISQKADALRAFQEAVDRQENLLRANPLARDRFGGELAKMYSELAGMQRDLDQPAEAAATALKRRPLRSKDGYDLFTVACEVAVCIPLVGKGKAELTGAEQAERARYGDQAMETLREAIRQGYNDWKQINEDKDLMALHARADFKELLKSQKAGPPKP